MNQIERDVLVLQDSYKKPIDYVRFTNAIPIVFNFQDYDIPSGATATVFCAKPSGAAVYANADLSGNTVTITVTDQMFIELGTTILQVKVENNGTTLVTFGWPVKVYENSTEGDIPPSQNESGFWDELQQQVDDAVENCNNAVDSVNQVIQESQQATQNANNAADNANEAAQQVFNQQYILTANQTFGLSDTVQPTAQGNALVESMEGDTWQGENPSPENPQHIYGIGDTGYFDGEWEQGWINPSTGEITNNTKVIHGVNKIPCTPKDNIKLISDSFVDYLIVAFYKKDGTFISVKSSEQNVNQYDIIAPDESALFVPEVQINTGITPQTAGHIAVTINGKYAIKLETSGKNLIKFPYKVMSKTVYGVSYNAFQDGSYTISGTSTGTTIVELQQTYNSVDSYIVQLKLVNNSKYYAKDVQVLVMNNGVTSIIDAMDKEKIYTAKEGDEVIGFRVLALSGKAYFSDRVYYPIFCEYEEGMNKDYIPYQHSLSYLPISYPLYKGDQIVKIGSEYKVRREKGCIQSYSSESIPGEYVSSTGELSSGATVVYQLAAPVYDDIDQDQFYSIMAADELTNISLLGENENLVPTNVIKFPRNDDGALCTTAYAVAKKYEDAYQGMTPSGIEDRLAALETQMAALNAQTIIVE